MTAGLPDEYEIVSSPGDATYWETSEHYEHPLAPAFGGPGVVILDSGQEITEQYAIPFRLDLDEWVELEWRHVPPDHKEWEIWTGHGEGEPVRESEHWWPLASLPTGELKPDDVVWVRRRIW